MKRHRNLEEKKTKKPLSVFGQLLEKAVAKPVEENKPAAKLEQKETAQKSQPPAPSPVKSPIVQSNAHLTHKLGDAARSA